MRAIVKILVNIIHNLSLCILVLLWIIGAIDEIVGAKKTEQIFSAIGLPNSFISYWILCITVLIISFVTYNLKIKYDF